MKCIRVGSITTTTQIILDNNRCTILLVLVIPAIPSTHFFLSDTRALKILPAADGLNWSEASWQSKSKSKSKLLYDWQSVSQSECLGIEYPCGTCDQMLFPIGMLLSEICGLLSGGRPLWREDGSAICSVITQWSESLRTRNRLPRISLLMFWGGPYIEPIRKRRSLLRAVYWDVS
jgi:hypothetical protein